MEFPQDFGGFQDLFVIGWNQNLFVIGWDENLVVIRWNEDLFVIGWNEGPSTSQVALLARILAKVIYDTNKDKFYLSLLFLFKRYTWWLVKCLSIISINWFLQSLFFSGFVSSLPNFLRRTYWNRSWATNFILGNKKFCQICILQMFNLWHQICSNRKFKIMTWEICLIQMFLFHLESRIASM